MALAFGPRLPWPVREGEWQLGVRREDRLRLVAVGRPSCLVPTGRAVGSGLEWKPDGLGDVSWVDGLSSGVPKNIPGSWALGSVFPVGPI